MDGVGTNKGNSGVVIWQDHQLVVIVPDCHNLHVVAGSLRETNESQIGTRLHVDSCHLALVEAKQAGFLHNDVLDSKHREESSHAGSFDKRALHVSDENCHILLLQAQVEMLSRRKHRPVQCQPGHGKLVLLDVCLRNRPIRNKCADLNG